MKFCLIFASRDGANCGPNLTRAEAAVNNGTLYANIYSVLNSIHRKADPKAKIVLLGYPYLEGNPNYRIRSGHGFNTFIDAGRRSAPSGTRAIKSTSRSSTN